MQVSMLLAEKLFVMFIMYTVGYTIVKSGLLQAKSSVTISKIILFVCSPCAIVNAFQIDCTVEKLKGIAVAFLAAVLVHVLFIVGTKMMNGVTKFNAIERASVIYTNAGFLVVPLVYSVLGPEWVFYTCAYSIVQTFLLWSHCRSLINEKEKFDWKKVMLNPNFIAIYIGIFVALFGIRFIAPVQDVMTSFADMLSPASMLVIGMLLGEKKLRELVSNPNIYRVLFYRLVVYSILTVVLLKGIVMLFPIQDVKQILIVIMWAGIAPVGTMVTQFAQIYDAESDYASNINAFSIIFCMITMPLITLLYEYIV